VWDVIVALEQSGFGTAIRRSQVLYPAANIGHIVFLVLFAGSVAVMDTRLLGGAVAAPLSSLVVAVRRIAVVALIGMISTGFMLFSADASKVADNAAFQVKMALIAAASAISVLLPISRSCRKCVRVGHPDNRTSIHNDESACYGPHEGNRGCIPFC